MLDLLYQWATRLEKSSSAIFSVKKTYLQTPSGNLLKTTGSSQIVSVPISAISARTIQTSHLKKLRSLITWVNNSLSSDFPDPRNPTQATLGGINFHPHKTVYLPKTKTNISPPPAGTFESLRCIPFPTQRENFFLVPWSLSSSCKHTQPAMFQLDSPSSIKVFLGTISTAISLVEGWWRTCSFGLKDNPLVLKKKQIEDWRNLLTGVQVLRSCGFSQILNTLTFLNLPWICISCFFALCEFFKQELNPKLYWVVTDT